MKIIWMTVDHHRTPDHLRDTKSVGQHRHLSFSPIGQQRRQIACVVGMLLHCGVIVPAGIRKTCSLTVAPFMNMEREETGLRIRKSFDLCRYQSPAALLRKLHSSP